MGHSIIFLHWWNRFEWWHRRLMIRYICVSNRKTQCLYCININDLKTILFMLGWSFYLIHYFLWQVSLTNLNIFVKITSFDRSPINFALTFWNIFLYSCACIVDCRFVKLEYLIVSWGDMTIYNVYIVFLSDWLESSNVIPIGNAIHIDKTKFNLRSRNR